MIVPALALLALVQEDAPPANIDPAVFAYYTCVVDTADQAETRTRDLAIKPAPEVVFIAAEANCQPLYAPALAAFFATTMKTAPIRAYVQDKDDKQVRAEVEAGLRSSLRDKIVQNISLARSGSVEDTHAHN